MNNKKQVRLFSSFEQENREEHKRRARLSPEERIHEFSIIQERIWGKGWTLKPIQKTARFETVEW